MPLNNKDFIEIEFTGKVKEGEIFDSNIKQDLEKIHSGHDHPVEPKPFIFCLGEHMFLDELDNFLIGKDAGEYEVELEPERAFGKRNPALVQMIPMRIFREHNTNPIPGALLNFDGRIGKALTVSGGRVMVDFNSPLSGKTVIYRINVKRKVDDINEKIKAVNEFFFKRNLDFTVDDKKLIIKTEKDMKKIVEMFGDKFKQLLGLDVDVIETEEADKERK
ncbi:MAG TPA: FKBP-type peptidyl-prolyl cis-trans isomerase [Candidatus Nanoarchaeia archaeon]|nr:FKBP-type peptidyl-prolyl cis-trans isomerase [Candidatus Nanoarchaeia archaeon]